MRFPFPPHNRLFARCATALLIAAAPASPTQAAAHVPASYIMWQMPASGVQFPIYVYSHGKQVGYVYAPSQQAFLGPYVPGKTNGNYQLYYSGGADSWNSCSVVLSKGRIDPKTTCQGVVVNPPQPKSNVYSIGLGAFAWPAAPTPPTGPKPVDYGHRTITLVNHTRYQTIWIGEHCTVSANPHNPKCANDQSLFEIPKGKSKLFTVDDKAQEGADYPAGLTSFGFTVTAYKDQGGHVIKTGGYGPGQNPYATKAEFTDLAVSTVNGIQFPTGANNLDASLVDGYNIGVRLYPKTPAYCTFTVPPEGSNILGAGAYSKPHPLARFEAALPSLCKKSSQLPAGKKTGAWDLTLSDKTGFQGCMSPCTYATKTWGADSGEAQQYCCSGAHGQPSTCTKPPVSSYVTNLAPPVSQNLYRFAYDDAIGDFACPAETDVIVEFVSPEPAQIR